MPDYALCNELLAEEGMDLSEQARVASALGYVGLELAPATLGPDPHRLPASRIASVRSRIEDHGIRVTGLHWLLSHLPDASITDPSRSNGARDVLLGLVDLCAELGGRVLVHGSPAQRRRPEGMEDAELTDHLAGFFGPIADHARAAGVTYCIEPLAECDVIHTVAEGAALVDAVGNPAFRTMIDCSAAGRTEPPVADLIRHWLPTGLIGHVHANDTNRGAPGMGDDPFGDIVAALDECGWPHPVGVEPFRTCVDARVTAAIGIATLKAHGRRG